MSALVWIVGGIIAFAFLVVILFSVIKSHPEDWKQDDEDQAEYLKQWYAEHKKK